MNKKNITTSLSEEELDRVCEGYGIGKPKDFKVDHMRMIGTDLFPFRY